MVKGVDLILTVILDVNSTVKITNHDSKKGAGVYIKM